MKSYHGVSWLLIRLARVRVPDGSPIKLGASRASEAPPLYQSGGPRSTLSGLPFLTGASGRGASVRRCICYTSDQRVSRRRSIARPGEPPQKLLTSPERERFRRPRRWIEAALIRATSRGSSRRSERRSGAGGQVRCLLRPSLRHSANL